MKYLKPYELTVMELKAYRVRLERLMDEKQVLLEKYSLPKAVSFEEKIMGSGDGRSPQQRYVDELLSPRESGMSLDQEITMCKGHIAQLEGDVKQLQQIYSELSSIEKDLLNEIGMGRNISKAVPKVADKNYVSDSTVWRKYKDLKKIQD
mgnify:CR=1 FL=1